MRRTAPEKEILTTEHAEIAENFMVVRNQTEETILAIKKINQGIEELQEIYKKTGRRFSMDGRMVGDIGEVIAANVYDIKLTDQIEQGHDGLWGNKKVQIKATYGDTSLGFSKQYKDMHYIGLKLFREPNQSGQIYEEIYNGKGGAIYGFLHETKSAPRRLENLENNLLVSVSLNDLRTLSAGQTERVAKR